MRGFVETNEGTGHGEGLWESGEMGKTLSEVWSHSHLSSAEGRGITQLSERKGTGGLTLPLCPPRPPTPAQRDPIPYS